MASAVPTRLERMTDNGRMRILGIDPGLQTTGFGVIELDGSAPRYVASGTIQTTHLPRGDLPARLKALFDGIREVRERYQPDAAAIEIVFVNVNPQSTLLLGQARGACITALVACDLLGQAEHDPNSGVCLICRSEEFGRRTMAEVEKQLAVLPTRDVAALSWRDHGIVYVAESAAEAVALSDRYAPEHLELHVSEVDYYFANLTNYGSLFIGEETTVAYGDKTIGTNHILPTSRAARYTGGVWVGKFLKTCTYQRMTREASIETGEVTARQCELENMLAHAITARVRVERYRSGE